MSEDMKKFLELMDKLKFDSVIRFTWGEEEVSLACDGMSIIENIECAEVEQDEELKWACKVNAQIGKYKFTGYVDKSKYQAYLEAKKAGESEVA